VAFNTLCAINKHSTMFLTDLLNTMKELLSPESFGVAGQWNIRYGSNA
jgi:hypothetical protein